MTVKAILEQKGYDVVTLERHTPLVQAAQLLTAKRIGAVVVLDDDDRIVGILSERDIVRAIGKGGAEALALSADKVMTSKVTTCTEAHTVNTVMELMTSGRFRHLPVEKDGRLAGIISIGDVVKWRIREVEREAQQIRDYIATA